MSRRWLLVIGAVGLAVLLMALAKDTPPDDYSVMTRPAPSPTAVATAEPSGDAVATARPSSASPSATPTPEQPTPATSASTTPAVESMPALGEAPSEMTISSAGIHVMLGAGGLNSKGVISPPPSTAMWFSDDSYGNVAPGQLGTGVIAGHVVAGGKPDVFHELDKTTVGDEVRLVYPSGVELEFRVISAEVISKDDLMHDKRLWESQSYERRVVIITCSDEQGKRPDGHRVANYVVIAVPVER